MAGAIIGGPIGAAVGGAAGFVAGGVAGQTIDPPEQVRTYVSTNAVEPVYLDGEVVVGAGLPETVVLHEVPRYEYRYVRKVNGETYWLTPTPGRSSTSSADDVRPAFSCSRGEGRWLEAHRRLALTFSRPFPV